MKVFPQGEYRFVEGELKTNLGEGNFIFVGSSTDMWVASSHWLAPVLGHCGKYRNRYLFQSKAPQQFGEHEFPPDTILGTTIETNRPYGDISKAPFVGDRFAEMLKVALPKMISIEPIMDFDLDILVGWVEEIAPEFVSIGADSKGHHLPEPSTEKTRQLIEQLRGTTTVKIKDNLKRLLGQRSRE